jgi:hypothetical protein
MKELGEAVNKSLSDSEHISEVVARIKEDGYDIFLVLEATIGVNRKDEKVSEQASAVSTFSMGTSESARKIGIKRQSRSHKARQDSTPERGKSGR